MDLAARRPAAGLVVESGFPSLRDAARAAYPFVPGFALRHLDHAFDSRGKIRRLRVPVLFVHGGRDKLVPVAMGRQLLEASPEPRFWHEVRGAGHDDVPEVGGSGYLRRLADFARQVAG